MWSRFTEYAAEIVAPPSDDEAAGGAQIGDELWSRFANIVAPTEPDHAADKGDVAVDEDEQERYISELERALLQKKKQNELLEERIRELEATQGSVDGAGDQSSEQTPASREKDEQISRLQQELLSLRTQAEEERTKMEKDHASENERLRNIVVGLEKRVAEMVVQCGVLEATLREERSAQQKAHGDDTKTAESNEPMTTSIFPKLVQAALVLSKSSPSSDGKSLEVGTTDEAVMSQVLEMTELTRQRLELLESQLAKIHSALVSFFKMEGVEIASDESAFFSEVQSKLGVLSHRLSKGRIDANEVQNLQKQLEIQIEKDEKNHKTISALQTQLSGVQASKARNDESLANRETEMLAVLESKEKTIAKLEASEQQLKHTLDQLGKELEDAHGEADELDKACQNQQQEIKKLQRKVNEVEEIKAVNEELRSRVRELEKSAQEYEQGYMELLQEAEAVKKQTEEEKAELVASTEAKVISTEQQMLYELQARLSACEADKLIAIQDADRLQSELDALDKVLLQFRTDHKQQRERLLELEQALEETRKADNQNGGQNNVGAISEEDFRRVMEVLSKRTQECEQLREALENSAKRFSSETEVLDKRLAAQLVVSYLESDKKHEVLQLMSRMMGFTDEQKLRAGILGDGQVVIPGNGGGGLFSSIFGIQSGSQASDTAVAGAEPKNINELWTDFLIDEAKR